MKRRSFLEQAGLAVAGGALARPAAAGTPQPDVAQGAASAAASSTILVTSAHAKLARLIGSRLAARFPVMLTSEVDAAADLPLIKCNLEAVAATDRLVRGVGAIVHVAEPAVPDPPTKWIDYRARLTYNLLQAAVRAQVRRLVYLSSLELLEAYGDEFLVDEDWRPRPGDDLRLLSHSLGEFTCREFARQGLLNVVVLRLGRLWDREAQAAPPAGDHWVDPRDAAQAVELALDMLGKQPATSPATWSVLHIQRDAPDSRFPITKAQQVLKFQPQYAS